jgi:hypothetical protein
VISANGHEEFLDLKVDGDAGPGDEIQRPAPVSLPVAVRWTVRRPLRGRVELLHDGRVVASLDGAAAPGAPLDLQASTEFRQSGWLAARRTDAQGHLVHTAAVFVTIDGAPVRASAEDAGYFVRYIDNLIEKTSPGGAWSPYFAVERELAQDRYRRARGLFQAIAEEARTASRREGGS